jgi:hypothetical protein
MVDAFGLVPILAHVPIDDMLANLNLKPDRLLIRRRAVV